MNKKQTKQFNAITKNLMKMNKSTYSYWLKKVNYPKDSLTKKRMKALWKRIAGIKIK